jgi:acyl-CoA thioesterase I
VAGYGYRTSISVISRKNLLILFAILVAVTFVFWRWQRETAYVNDPPTATGPWVAFGDSLTEGFGGSPGNDYPSLLSKRLGVQITNLGKSGDTTADGLGRLEEVTRSRPRVVLLCFGGNDSLNHESSAVTFGNLARIIDGLHQQGSFVVLIGIRSASLRDRNQKYFKQLAHEKHVLYMPDMLEGLAFKPVYMSDAVHPNDEGYRRISERLDKVLRPWLPKLTPPENSKL